ncbi:MAG TPA: cation transporter [Clostridiaceae bacterium]|nr:cation transporter [Clostridiaceae bacterium]
MTNLLIRLFVKDYDNTTNAHVRERYGKFAGIVGIASNFLLFLIKITAGVLFHSISITADAVNNLSDSGSSVVTLIGFKISGKPADEKHPFGHARMEYISGLIVSFIILLIGIQLVQRSVSRIVQPVPGEFSVLLIILLSVSILIKLWQFLFYRKIGRIIKSDTLFATSIDSRNDIFATSAVLTASIISRLTGFNLDGYIGTVVALFIVISGIKLTNDTISPLLGMAPTKELVDLIYRKILSYEGVIGLHDLTIHNYGPSKRYASVHCEVPAEQDIMISHDIIDNIERDFMKDLGIHLVIHLDPVITDNAKINDLKLKVKNIIEDISLDITMHDFRVVIGVTHSNLIFDVVVPYDCKYDDEELVDIISEKIEAMDGNYRAVIIVDHAYVPSDIH